MFEIRNTFWLIFFAFHVKYVCTYFIHTQSGICVTTIMPAIITANYNTSFETPGPLITVDPCLVYLLSRLLIILLIKEERKITRV